MGTDHFTPSLNLGEDFTSMGFHAESKRTHYPFSWNVFYKDDIFEVISVDVRDDNSFVCACATWTEGFHLSSYDIPTLTKEVSNAVIDTLYEIVFGSANVPSEVKPQWVLPSLESVA